MNCPKCNNSINEGALFCKNCGTKIDKDINLGWKIGLIVIQIFCTMPLITMYNSPTSESIVLYFISFIVIFSAIWFSIETYKQLPGTKLALIIGMIFIEATFVSFINTLQNNIDGFVNAVIVLSFMLFLTIFFIKKIAKREENQIEQFIKEKEMKQKGATYFETLSHSYGLPCTLNSNVQVELYPEHIMFLLSNSKTVKLPKEKIQSIQTKTEKELAQAYSNAQTSGGLGGAILGGLTFGALGAIVGSNISSKKTNSTVKYKYDEIYYVLINFYSNNEHKTIALISTSLEKANKLTSACNNLYIEKEIVL